MVEALPEICGGGPVLIAGDAADRALAAVIDAGGIAELADASGIPDAVQVGEAALGRAMPPVGHRPAPIYLRPPDAVRPRNGGRLRP